MPQMKRFEDQVTTPLPLAVGVALRVMANAQGLSISLLIRRALVEYSKNNEMFRKLVDHFETLTPDQLMHEKARLITLPGYVSVGQKIIEDYLAAREQ